MQGKIIAVYDGQRRDSFVTVEVQIPFREWVKDDVRKHDEVVLVKAP